jgi:hypothetical protein
MNGRGMEWSGSASFGGDDDHEKLIVCSTSLKLNCGSDP